MKEVTVTLQSLGAERREPLKIMVDNTFDLKSDYYEYQIGVKKDPNGNAVSGAMIGPNHYVRFSDVIDISVVEIKQETFPI